jgi:hypothetical protein
MPRIRTVFRQSPMAYRFRCKQCHVLLSQTAMKQPCAATPIRTRKIVRRFNFVLMVAAFCCKDVVAQVPLSPAGDGHLTVPVTANGIGPFPFILDTGADETGVYQWFAEQQHFPHGKSEELIGQTGSTQAETYKLKSVTLDGRSLRHVVADGFPNRHDEGRQAGVLGNDFMDRAIAIFDFPCGTVQVLAKPFDMRKLPGGNMPAASSIGQGRNPTDLAGHGKRGEGTSCIGYRLKGHAYQCKVCSRRAYRHVLS